MATKKKKRTATTDLQRTVTRLRREGQRLATGLERDVRRLAKRVRAELRKDIGGRAATAVRTGRDAVASVERRIAALGEQLLKQLQAATSREVAALERRISDLERRNAELETRLVDLLPGSSRD
jgi:phage host-nuclease inhibitor protein Gam